MPGTLLSSIRTRFILAVMLCISLIVAVGFAMILDRDINHLKSELLREARSYSELLSQDYARLIAFGSVEHAAGLTARLRSREMIESVTLFDRQEQPVYTYRQQGLQSGYEPDAIRHGNYSFVDDKLLIDEPVEYNGVNYGSAFVQLSTDRLQETVGRFVLQGMVVAVALAVTGMLLLYLIQRNLTEPIQQLASIFRRTGESQDYSALLPTTRNDEIGDLFRGFNAMQEQLRQAHNSLGQNEKRLKYALSVANDGIWERDVVTGEVYLDARCYTLAGYNPNAFEQTFDAFISRVFPDDVDKVVQAIKTRVDGKDDVHELEFRFRHKDGSYMWMLGRGKAVEWDADDKPARIMGTLTDITQRKRAEHALHKSELLYRNLIETTSAVAWEFDKTTNRFTYMGPQIETLTGYPAHLWTDMDYWLQHIHPDDREHAVNTCQQLALTEDQYTIDYRCITASDDIVWIRDAISVIREHGKVVMLRGFFIDITEMKRTEEVLRRSQKLEAIGQLTGGIAHDFNNMLGVILGNISLLEQQNSFDEKTQKRIDAIEKSSRRAVDLTRRLLDFSRREPGSYAAVNINTLIQDMHNLMTQTLTPQIEIDYRFDPDLWLTGIDTGDFENALLNLAINARDAMNGKGKLGIETRNIRLDEKYCQLNPEVRPGDYVELAVSDNGHGMPPDIADRIFDPFFTTKEHGKGTGLGLAMVFGFVKRSRGMIKAYSEPDIGTTMRIYLPRMDDSDMPQHRSESRQQPAGGSEAILIVDDETGLLEMVSEFCSELGYQVHGASNGQQALEKLQQQPDIQLLFSDVVMPGMNGYELAEQAVALRPELKVLLTSGYTDMAVAHNGQARFNANLLNKPYNLTELSQRIRQTLDDS